MTEKDKAFYCAWTNVIEWMRAYANERGPAIFEKEADFPDYIYRMERPYELPTIVMSASLSDCDGKPVLMLNASPRHAIFKEVIVHPFESHSYRKLKLNSDGNALAEGKRQFTREMLYSLADGLFRNSAAP